MGQGVGDGSVGLGLVVAEWLGFVCRGQVRHLAVVVKGQWRERGLGQE